MDKIPEVRRHLLTDMCAVDLVYAYVWFVEENHDQHPYTREPLAEQDRLRLRAAFERHRSDASVEGLYRRIRPQSVHRNAEQEMFRCLEDVLGGMYPLPSFRCMWESIGGAQVLEDYRQVRTQLLRCGLGACGLTFGRLDTDNFPTRLPVRGKGPRRHAHAFARRWIRAYQDLTRPADRVTLALVLGEVWTARGQKTAVDQDPDPP